MKVKVQEMGIEVKEAKLICVIWVISCFLWCSHICVQRPLNVGRWTKGGYGAEGGEGPGRKAAGRVLVCQGPDAVTVSLSPLLCPSLPLQAAINLLFRPAWVVVMPRACGRGAAALSGRTVCPEGGQPQTPTARLGKQLEKR